MNNKNNLNFIIDILMFLALALIAGIGFLLKYSGMIIRDLSAQGISASITFLGLKGRQWGQIHFWVSILFLLLMLIHIILHWDWIKCVYGNMIKNRFASFIMALILIIVSITLFIFPFIIRPEITVKGASSCSGSGCATCATNK